MPEIKNLEGLSGQDLQRELQHGGKFVVYQFCISIVIMTFRRSSDIYFIRSTENGVLTGLGFTFLTFMLGWWGIPWGPIYTIQSLYKNLSGGVDVTDEVVAALVQEASAQPQEA